MLKTSGYRWLCVGLIVILAASMANSVLANCGYRHGYYDEITDRWTAQPPCRTDADPPEICIDGRVLHILYFAKEGTTLAPDIRSHLSDLVAFRDDWDRTMHWFAPHGFYIMGFADETEVQETRGFALGFARAEAVKAELLTLGVPENWISTTSYGITRTPCTPSSRELSAKNRYALIWIYPVKHLPPTLPMLEFDSHK